MVKKAKFSIYDDKKMKLTRKKLLHIALSDAIKSRADVYVENEEMQEIYFNFPEKVCVIRFSQPEQFTKWASVCKGLFILPPVPSDNTNPFESSSSASSGDSVTGTPPINPAAKPLSPRLSDPTPASSSAIANDNRVRSSTTNSNNSPRLSAFGRPTLTASTNWNVNTPSTPSKPTPPEDVLDLATTNDPEVLKQEILSLRKKNALLADERENLLSILGLEKEFVRDRQNKLESWEHFARLVIFKAVCNEKKNEKLKGKLNKILAKSLPTNKNLKISRMEVVLVNLPTRFEESPNFRLSNYVDEEGIATFMFEWFPQNCTCTIQIDGQKYLGGTIPISFKVSMDLLSQLKIKGELLVSKGEENQFLISLPRLPDLTFANPSKIQIGDIFDIASFTVVQKIVESAVFSALKKNLMFPKWKEVRF